MPAWSKEADWLPLSNALAQVDFWKKDLKQAEQFLNYVESFRKYNLSGFDDIYAEAIKDINESRIGLSDSRRVLEETQKRINPPNN